MSESHPDFSLETLSEVVNYNRFVIGRMRPFLGKRVLELGAGIGNLTPLFLEEGREVTAIDIEQSLITAHRQRVAATPALRVECISIQDVAKRVGERSFYDSVVSSNVLEHIADDVMKEVMAAMHAVLRPGGYAVHWVPAFQSIFGTIDASFGHYRRYDKRMAAKLFQDSGFRVVSCSYWNIIGFFGWWFNGRVLRKREIHRPSAVAFDKFLMPLVRVIEPAIWRPFGQSLLMVAKKAT